MQMILRVLFWTVTLGVAIALAQTAEGEIAGRIDDKSGVPLPGILITITNGDRTREVITDSDGRFVFRSLSMGTYRVVAELVGFVSVSSEINLSASNPRAFLGWALEVGCLQDDIRLR
jgi:carboxypeptidase family protein